LKRRLKNWAAASGLFGVKASDHVADGITKRPNTHSLASRRDLRREKFRYFRATLRSMAAPFNPGNDAPAHFLLTKKSNGRWSANCKTGSFVGGILHWHRRLGYKIDRHLQIIALQIFKTVFNLPRIWQIQ
jgi:hypothetical protein